MKTTETLLTEEKFIAIILFLLDRDVTSVSEDSISDEERKNLQTLKMDLSKKIPSGKGKLDFLSKSLDTFTADKLLDTDNSEIDLNISVNDFTKKLQTRLDVN